MPTPKKSDLLFELRIYDVVPGKLDALQARFRQHTLKLFEKHGMAVLGFWVTSHRDARASEAIVYLLAWNSREAADAAWKSFRADPEWVRVRQETEADGPLVARFQSRFMTATDYSPLK